MEIPKAPALIRLFQNSYFEYLWTLLDIGIALNTKILRNDVLSFVENNKIPNNLRLKEETKALMKELMMQIMQLMSNMQHIKNIIKQRMTKQVS